MLGWGREWRRCGCSSEWIAGAGSGLGRGGRAARNEMNNRGTGRRAGQLDDEKGVFGLTR